MMTNYSYYETEAGYKIDGKTNEDIVMAGGGTRNHLTKEDSFFHSARNFPNGTLIETDVDYSQDYGDQFLLEIKGNMYDNSMPLDAKIQGYIYLNGANPLLNVAAYTTCYYWKIITALNLNGKLCFWFPQLSYWQGFDVKLTRGYGGIEQGQNRVVNVSDSADPGGTKRVSIYLKTLATQEYVNENFATIQNLNSKANGQENARAIGFSSGTYPTDDGIEFPYFYFDNGTKTGYIPIATHGYVNSKLAVELENYVPKYVASTIHARKTFIGGTGNDYIGSAIMINGNGQTNTIYPTLAFHQPGLYAATLSHRGDGFHFMDMSGTNYHNITSLGFIKTGSSDSKVLLGGGGDKSISDFITVDSWNNITGKKWFKTDNGNDWDNNTLRIHGINGHDAGLSFYRDGVDIGQLIFDGYYFKTTDSTGTGYKGIKSSQFIKNGSDGNHVLLGDGNDKAISDFAGAVDNATAIGFIAGLAEAPYIYHLTAGNVRLARYDWVLSQNYLNITQGDGRYIQREDSSIVGAGFIGNSEIKPYFKHSTAGSIELAPKEYVQNIILSRVLSENNAFALGFVGGTANTPYVKHANGAEIRLSTEEWSSINFVTLFSDQNITGVKTHLVSPKVPSAIESDDAVPLGQTEEIIQTRINDTFAEVIYQNIANDLTFNFSAYRNVRVVTIICKGNNFQNIRVENMPKGVTLKIMNSSQYLNPTIYFDGGTIVTSIGNTTWAEFYRDQDGDIFKNNVNGTNIIN
ncbi:hypothetical protein [Chryseobacterium mulctrae]|uniref:hypothetical protein n=1 Tax=Chryseobacterium mulctrae TaxID=2576777 RepID=UPI0011179600|nr:hypothetical protein [Chryseobacterium mulctrae]